MGKSEVGYNMGMVRGKPQASHARGRAGHGRGSLTWACTRELGAMRAGHARGHGHGDGVHAW